MNKNELVNIISNHFGVAAANISDDKAIDMPLIKAFRKEVKKLRAFFALLEMETNGVAHFTLSKQIQKLYINMGIAAKLHFHFDKIEEYCLNFSYAVPVLYLKKIKQNINYWNDRTKELLREQNNFDSDEKLIISFLPDQLQSVSIKKFLEYSSYELQRLRRLDDDAALQDIKKLLEDISYNWQFIQPHTHLLPGTFSQLAYTNEWIKMLASLHKNSIDIALLRVSGTDIPGEEGILKNMEQKLIAHGNLLRQNIYTQLNQVKSNKTVHKSHESLNRQSSLNRTI